MAMESASEGGEQSNVAAADPVTGARSRASLQTHLQRELDRAANGGACAVFLFDVDFFKTVNDVYGHLRGDQVLRQLADCVRQAVRRQDALFRYGGDEFVLILPETGRIDAIRLALRLTDWIRGTELPGEPPLHLTISLGVATFPEDGDTPLALLACADRRNYLAKRRGRGGAVADDADDASLVDSGSRLWERDTALSTTHEFLTRLPVARQGSLRVRGQQGAGHTRFLTEAGRLARLRGFTVVPVPPAPTLLPAPPRGPSVLLLADLDATARVTALIDEWTQLDAIPEVLGLAYASTGPGHVEAPLPELGNVELTPWSPATLCVWLRATLHGEPSRTLVSWLARQTGGLPAAAIRELERLRARNGLIATGVEGWTISPAMLGRPRRQIRLPTPLTALLGREREIQVATRLLGTGRLVSLVGAGGIGKTRLSLAVAQAVADTYEDGVVFVPLAQTTHQDEVIEAIAQVLGVEENPGQPRLDGIVEHLADTSMLLLLDNFEQVLDAGPAIGSILSAAPDIAILVTSREPVGIYGEQVYRVPPLPLPDLTTLPRGLAGVSIAVAQSPAVALFDQRARAANAEFALTPETLPAVAALCHRLDGLPLAIELAAARTNHLTPQMVLTRLGSHLEALNEGPRDRPARQQTLRGAIGWSFGLLDPVEQQVFTTFAVFAGSATAEAVLAVTEDIGPGMSASDDETQRGKELTDLLDTLVNKSLLTAEAQADGGRRYAMLNTINAYASERLTELRSMLPHRRHLTYFTALAQRAGVGMTTQDQAQWAEALEREYPNLRAALGWALSTGDVTAAARICMGLWRHWRNGAHIGDGREWLDQILTAVPQRLTPTERAGLLYPAAVLAATQDDTATASRLGSECLAVAERVGDREGAAQAHNILGVAAMLTGGYGEAADHFRYCLDVWRHLDRKPGMAIALGNLAKVALRLGDVLDASRHINQCLALERAAGNRRGVLLGLTCLSEIKLAQNDLTSARSAAREVLELATEVGDLFGEAVALHQLGQVALAVGERETALTLFLDALERRYELGDRADLAISLDSVAEVVVADDPEMAVRLLAAVDSLRRRYGLAAPADRSARRRATLTAARANLAERHFVNAWNIGLNTPLELIVDQALDCAPAQRTARPHGHSG